MLEQIGINLKSLNIDKLKSEYQEFVRQKKELLEFMLTFIAESGYPRLTDSIKKPILPHS